MQLLLLIISTIFVFFLPGFFISLIFFKWKSIDLIERLMVSFGISFATIPFILFYNNMFGAGISTITVLATIATILFLTGIILAMQK